MQVVDAQMHVWQAPTAIRPWPPEGIAFHHGPSSVSAEDLIREMDGAGVAAAVLVPPSFEGDRNDVVVAAVNRYPDRFRALARATLDATDARDVLDSIIEQWQFVGLRVTFNGRAKGWLTDGTIDWLWPYAAERGLAISMYPPTLLDHVERIASAYPSLRLSIDHLALGLDVSGAAITTVIDRLCQLGRYPNVAVKATCLPSYVKEPYPFPTLAPVLQRVVESFGPTRVFWGSDLTRLSCPYTECLQFFEEALAYLSRDELALILGRGLEDWFQWKR